MKSVNVNYEIGSETIDLTLEGETFVGEPRVLVNEDVNLIDDLDWHKKGYAVEQFLTPELNVQLKKGLTEMVKALVVEAGGSVDHDFTIETYHKYVNDEIHLSIAKIIQPGWNVDTFPVDFGLVNKRVSEIVNKTS